MTGPSLEATSKEPIFAVIDDDVFVDCKVQSIANYTLLWRFIKPSARDEDEGEILSAGMVRVSTDSRLKVLHEPGESLIRVTPTSHVSSRQHILQQYFYFCILFQKIPCFGPKNARLFILS